MVLQYEMKVDSEASKNTFKTTMLLLGLLIFVYIYIYIDISSSIYIKRSAPQVVQLAF